MMSKNDLLGDKAQASAGNGSSSAARRDRNGMAAECPSSAECSSPAEAAAETPEVFQMPPVPTNRVRARIHHLGAAAFVFVDEPLSRNE